MSGKQGRILSVDFLRGLTVAFMIFVNSPGSWDYVLPWFAHAKWNGCTPTDLIFPSFLFVVGLSVYLSLSPQKERGEHSKLIPKILKRAAILLLLGLLLNGFPYYNLSTLRIPGVLQRIAVVFLVTAITFLYTSKRFHYTLTSILLLGYWAAMTLIPVPGFGVSSLEPDTNLAAWVDHTLLGGHVWAQSKPWDPEGILSTFPSIASGLIGLLIGPVLMAKTLDNSLKVKRLLIIGIILIIIALLWNQYFPFNKNIWTSSYVLYSSGIITLLLAASYWILDIRQYSSIATPFIPFGANAISAYVLSELIEACLYLIPVGTQESAKGWIFSHVYASWLNPYLASHLMALTMILVVYIPIYILYKKRIFIKV